MKTSIYQGIKIILGQCTWSQWHKHTRWKSIPPEPSNQLKKDLTDLENIISNQDISFIFFNASWCPDSRKEMPELMGLLESAGISLKRIQIIGLDMEKRDPDGLFKKYSIVDIPTLVVTRDREELGRVVLHPEGGWLKALLSILHSGHKKA